MGGAALLAALVAACTRPAPASGPAPGISTLPERTTTTNPYSVPAVIDAAYVNRTLAALEATFGDIAQGQWDAYLARYPVCPGAEAPLLPSVIAMQVWRRVVLPAPRPYIAPGWGLTGKDAYLETRGQERFVHHEDTELGPIDIVATGRYVVDWGDGDTSWSYSGPGQPWPEGEIRHHYRNVGTYDVVVREEWTATWTMADGSGTLAGLRTEGRIDGFTVKQVQAVVLPG